MRQTDCDLPDEASPGRYVIPMRFGYAGRAFGQFREAILNLVDEE